MKRLNIRNLLNDRTILDEFCESIKNGGVAVIPTDTLYGFAVAAHRDDAVAAVYQIKERDARKPLILFLQELQQLKDLGMRLEPDQESLLRRYWPGALTAVLNRPENPSLSAFTFPTLGVRIPGHQLLLQLMGNLSCLLLTTSANRSGLPSAPDPDFIADEFSHEIDWLIEDGVMNGSLPSTVIDLTVRPFKILRAGAIEPQL